VRRSRFGLSHGRGGIVRSTDCASRRAGGGGRWRGHLQSDEFAVPHVRRQCDGGKARGNFGGTHRNGAQRDRPFRTGNSRLQRQIGNGRATLTAGTPRRRRQALRRFIRLKPAALPQPAIPAYLSDSHQRSGTPDERYLGGFYMTVAIRSRRFAQIFLAAAFGLASFAGAASAQKQGGSITFGLELDIFGFDPLKVGAYDTATFTAAAAIFDTLTTLDDKGGVQPKLALSWDHSEDFRTWTFKLRPGVKFHDGTPFNAEAAKANFDRQKDPANKCRCAFYITQIHDVQAPDELTLVYNLTDPAVNLPATLTIQSQNNVIQSPTAWKTRGDDYNRNPVGTGPYILKSWTAGARMVLERNPDYWNKGHPYLDRIVLKPLPDAQSRFASLQSGEADIIWDDESSADNIQRAQKDSRMTVHTYVGSGAQVYAFNAKVAPFDDVRVRQALGMAIARKKMERGHRQRACEADHQSLRRRSVGQVQGRRRAAQRCGKGQGPDQGLWQAGRLQDDRHRDAARAQYRPGIAAVLEAGRRHHGDRADRSSHRRAARLHASVPADAVADRRSR